MGAREKLNSVHVWGIIILGTFIAWLTDSLLMGLIACVIGVAMALGDDSIRIEPTLGQGRRH